MLQIVNLTIFISFSFQTLGGTAKAFFSPEKRDHVLDLYEPYDSPDQRENMRKLIQRVNVILRVMSSSSKIDVDSFHDFNIKTYVFLLKLFPWMDIQDSLHGAFHSAQLIKLYNNGFGLGQYEEGMTPPRGLATQF